MPDDDKKPNPSFWNPRVDPTTIKPADNVTFSRPSLILKSTTHKLNRPFDFSACAWDRKDFWSQKEPMTEYYYRKEQDGKDKK
ncbi:hypothetical protein INT46_008435 [Mucor plumbeus]|uniref:Uncharacterized protein n=1 Tax=Mucor plumbeus TaxID=97098 RepID=A0A8H7VC63_9FUNG|nr:hypothetical protein INT46_008435 [Mucor plumbeus]